MAGYASRPYKYYSMFCFDCNCNYAFKGGKYKGFTVTRGVRQGCPLSPVMFVLVVDIMLRALQRDAGLCARAFADDIGAVTGDL